MIRPDRQTQAFLLSGLLTIGLFGTGFLLWHDELATLWPNRDVEQSEEPDYLPSPEQLSEFTLYFVRTLPLYEQQAMPPITLVANNDHGNGSRTLLYRVESTPIAEVTLTVQDWYVVEHQVTIRTPSGQLAVTSPEPNQIVSTTSSLTVKGRSQSETVELVLRDDESGQVLDTQSATVRNDEFSATFSLASVNRQAITVEVLSDGELLSLPLIVDTYVE